MQRVQSNSAENSEFGCMEGAELLVWERVEGTSTLLHSWPEYLLFSIVSHLQLHSLMERWKGKITPAKILMSLKRKWQKLGQLLGLSSRELEHFKKEEKKKIGRCRCVFSHWIDSNGYLPTYPLSWVGVEKILHDLKQRRMADKGNKHCPFTESQIGLKTLLSKVQLQWRIQG